MKKISLILILILSIFILSGCSTRKAFTYNVETGDRVKVDLNTSGGYDITSKLPFEIKYNDETQCQGTFITLDGYQQYLNVVNNDGSSKIIESNSIDNISYTFYNYNDTEWNYIIKINNSNTGVLLGSNVSINSAKNCFERLSLSIE